MLRKIVLLAAVLVMASAAPAFAQYHPDPPSVQGPGTAVAGQRVTYSGQGCGADQRVTLYFVGGNQNFTRHTTSAADGTYTIDVKLPGGLKAGTYRVVATCGEGSATTTVRITAKSHHHHDDDDHHSSHHHKHHKKSDKKHDKDDKKHDKSEKSGKH